MIKIKDIIIKQGYGQWGTPEVIAIGDNDEKFKVDQEILGKFLLNQEFVITKDKSDNARRKYSVIAPVIK